ncbi:PAS domain S-box protein [Bosea sp. R86505]|uniref:PAS domain S-box protein n=1 Tax=Bosea sp. R86505 TaxID=3101710 RepID=UPI00366B8328
MDSSCSRPKAAARSSSNAEATWTQTLPDWIEAHVRTFRFLGGVARFVVRDNLKSGVQKASFYEHEINRSYGLIAAHSSPKLPYAPSMAIARICVIVFKNLSVYPPPNPGRYLLIRLSIRARLTLLVSAVVGPVMVFAFLLLWGFQQSERGRAEEAAFDVVRRASAIVDREIAEMTAALEVLATSPSLQSGDLAAFDSQARAVLQTRGRFISMRNRSGQQVVNSNLPFGAALPIATDPVLLATDARIFATGGVFYSDMFLGTTTRTPLVMISETVRQGGEVAYALSLTIDPARLAKLLADAAPADWTVSLIDRRNRIIARSRQHERFVNNEATETFRKNAVGDGGSYVGTTLDGVEVLSAYSRSSTTGWRVAAAVPMAVIRAPLIQSTRQVLAAAGAALALSLLLAALVSRGIARPFQAVAAAAGKMGRGQAVVLPPTGLVEADAIGAALMRAASESGDREKSLRESEARYRQALEVGKIGSWETDFAKGERLWSSEAMAIFGISLPGGIGQVGGPDDEWRAALHEDDTDIDEAIQASLLGQDEHDFEYRIRRPGGAVTYLHGHARVIERHATGRPSRTVNVVADVTKRRVAERALQSSEAKLEAIIASAPIGIVLADEDGAIYDGNAKAEAIFGHPIFHSKDKDSYGEWVSFHADGSRVSGDEYPLARALAGEEHPSLEVHYRRPDGSRIWLSLIGAAVRDEDGRIVGALVAILDIDAERHATQALSSLNAELERRVGQALAERRLLAEIIDNTAMQVQIVGLDWCWLAINRAAAEEFARIHGVRPKAGDDMRRLLQAQPERRVAVEAVEAVWARALGGEEFVETAEFGDPAFDRRAHEVRSYNLFDADGRRIGAYQFVTDVTERLAEQRKLNDLQKTETIGQLTGGVAHDFNNLLAAILSNLDLARKRIDDVNTTKLLDGAIKGAERGAALTGRLLAFARRQDLKTGPIDLAGLVQGMQDLLGRSLHAGIAVSVKMPPGLPPVLADANQLEMALLNLAINARDAMPDGGALTIEAAPHAASSNRDDRLAEGRYVRLSVSDTGHGMDKETVKRATEPFFTTKGVGKGTGLGLSMVQGLAAQSGGLMSIESTIGRGTTIVIYLPLAEPQADGAASRKEAPAAARAIHGLLTALVVDDDVLVGMGTAAMLEDLGHSVIEASSGEEALSRLAEHPEIDIVITDQSMPGMTGLQLADEVRRRRPELPVVLATGYADLPNGQTTDLPRLAKPFRQEELAKVIAESLARS